MTHVPATDLGFKLPMVKLSKFNYYIYNEYNEICPHGFLVMYLINDAIFDEGIWAIASSGFL